MTRQLSMLDLWEAKPVAVRLPVDRDGSVLQGEPDETLILPHPRMAWPLARIELHRHADGRWMWSASTAGGGYKVGPKWGRFAETRSGALYHAALEIMERADRVRDPSGASITSQQLAQIKAWAVSMKERAA